MNIYQLTTKYIEDMEYLEQGIDVKTGEIIDLENKEKIQEIKEAISKDVVEKASNIIKVISNRTIQADLIQKEIERLEKYLKSYENATNALKKIVSNTMETLNLTKIETESGRISIRKSQSVNIIEQDKIPSKYIKQTITEKVDKVAVKEDIKQGILVDGAILKTNYSLVIK